MKKIIIILIVLVISLSGCRTIPLPDGPQDSLFIISCSLDKTYRNGEWGVKQVSILIKNIDTQKEYRMSTAPGADYFAVSLPPGKYRTTKAFISIEHLEGDHKEVQDRYISAISFFLKSNIVFFSNYNISLTESGSWYSIYSNKIYFSENRKKKLNGILNSLKQNPKWEAWENYKIIGLE